MHIQKNLNWFIMLCRHSNPLTTLTVKTMAAIENMDTATMASIRTKAPLFLFFMQSSRQQMGTTFRIFTFYSKSCEKNKFVKLYHKFGD